MEEIINDFIKNNKIEMHETGLYLIGKGDLKRFLENYEQRSEQLKTVNIPLEFHEWKDKLNIENVVDCVYKIGDDHIGINDVLEMYQDYVFSF